MAEMSNYPPLRIGLITSLLQMKTDIEANDKYLYDPSCPYDEDIIEVLRKLFKTKIIEKIVVQQVELPASGGPEKRRGRPKKSGQVSDIGTIEVEDQVQDIIKQLRDLKPDGVKMDVATELQIIKTKAMLVEKLLSMEERAYNVKKMSTFQDVVIQILDDCVSEDMRDAFLKKIGPYRT